MDYIIEALGHNTHSRTHVPTINSIYTEMQQHVDTHRPRYGRKNRLFEQMPQWSDKFVDGSRVGRGDSIHRREGANTGSEWSITAKRYF
jgi:hypothetical protein